MNHQSQAYAYRHCILFNFPYLLTGLILHISDLQKSTGLDNNIPDINWGNLLA